MMPPDSAFRPTLFPKISPRPMCAAASLALHHLALDHHLGRDAGWSVRAATARRAAHSLEAAQHVLQRVC